MFQVRVLDERRGIVRIRLVDRARCAGLATCAATAVRARLVVLRDDDTDDNAGNDEDDEA